MDIDLLSKMVKELILDSDVVTLPGVGSFVAELVPSTFSDRGYTINPPYRRLSFRPREEGDTLLVELYAKSNNLDYGTAESLMKSYLSEMRDLLKDKKTIVFPGLGRLRATRENNFFFIADEDLNIYPDGFGLQPVSLKTHVETEDEVSAAVAELRSFLDDDPKDVAVPQPIMEPVGPTEEEIAAKEEEERANAERLAKELAEREAAERAEAERAEAERLAAEKEEKERMAAEARKKAEAEKLAAARAEARRVAEEKARVEQARIMEERRLAAHKKEAAARRREQTFGKIWKVCKRVGAVAAVLALLLGAYMALGRLAPDFMDRFLYSQQELEILHHTFTLNL